MAVGTSSAIDGAKESKRKKVDNEEKKKVKSSQYNCIVFCLDGSEIAANVDKSSKGEVLFNTVVEALSVTQKEYMGLMFLNETGVKCWLDIHKDMKHQIGDAPCRFNFRIKFYEPEPTRIHDEFTRYLLYLQLRDDLVNGRLLVNPSTYAILGSFTLQAELGDFNLSDSGRDYLGKYQFSPNDDDWILDKVYNLHRDHCGQSPAQAELNFLEVAKKVPKYGVDIHSARIDLNPVEVGVAALGINIYKDENREKLLRWQSIDIISYKKRKLSVKLKQGLEEDEEKKKPKLLYSLLFDSAKECKQCYKSCVEYHTFFRLTQPDSPRKKTDKLKPGSSFRYSDRTLYQLRQQPANNENGSPRHFDRTPSIKDRSKENFLKQKEEKRNEDVPSIINLQVQYEEVDVDSDNYNDNDFDPKEWEIVEKVHPNGVLKKVRRRKIPLKSGQALTDLVQEKNESVAIEYIPLQYEEIELDKRILENDNYDSSEWQEVEKTYPDGEVKCFRRKYFVVKAKKFIIEGNQKREVFEELPLYEEEMVNYEEVQFNDQDTFDTKEWEIIEKPFSDGTTKLVRRRALSVTPERFVTQKDGRKDKVFNHIPIVKQESPKECSDVELNDAIPESLQYNTNEWEVVKQYYPDGSKKTVRRLKNAKVHKPCKILIKENGSEIIADASVIFVEEISPKMEDKKKNELSVDKKDAPRSLVVSTKPYLFQPFIKEECLYEDDPVEYEEVDIDPNNPESLAFDVTVWEVIERKMPDGKIKKVRRRIVIVKKQTVNIFEKEIKKNEPKQEKPIVEEIVEDKNMYEEFDENKNYDDKEWKIIEKVLPNGLRKKFCCRITIPKVIEVEEEDECLEPILVEEGPLQYEEFEIDENQQSNIDLDPLDWEIVEKASETGVVRKCYRRMIALKTVKTSRFIQNSIDGDLKKTEDDLSAPILVEEIPVEYEEYPLEKDSKDIFDPKDWEIVEKAQANMQIKRCRRRIVVKPLTKIKCLVHPNGIKEQVSSDNLIEEGPLLFYLKPHDEYTPLQPNEEVFVKTTSNGTSIKVRRQFVATKQIKAVRIFIHADGTRDIEEVSKNAPCIEEEIPVQCEEVDEKESSSSDENEWQSVEVMTSSGTLKKIRRRILPISSRKKVFLIRPDGNKEEVCDDLNEPDTEWEEIVENDTTALSLNPKEWKIEERLQPDGSTKKFKCRIKISSEKVISEVKCQEVVSTVLCSQPDTWKEDADERVPEDGREWEVIQRLEPGGVNIRVRQRPVFRISSYKSNEDSETDANLSMDDILSEISDLSKSLAEEDLNSSINIKANINEPPKHNDAEEKQKIDKENIWKEDQQAFLAKEEELREANKATLSSIFDLPEMDEEMLNSPYKSGSFNENDGTDDFPKLDLSISNNQKVYVSISTNKMEKKKPPPVATKRNSYSSDSFSLDRKHNVQLTNTSPSSTILNSNANEDSISSVEPETRHSSTGQDQLDYRQPLESGPHKEVIYTVTDVSKVEQGEGGFVKAVREKHEGIASTDKNAHRSSINGKNLVKNQAGQSDLPKGHVPTRTTSFKENTDDVIVTYTPPSVSVKPTIIRPASSELPEEEISFSEKKISEELCSENDFVESTGIPVVDTHAVVFMEPADVDKKSSLENVFVETKTLQIQENDIQSSSSSNHQIITHILPTEVITKTIILETDPSTLSQEEVDRLFDQEGCDQQTVTSATVTTTIKKIITGQTITVSGNVSEDEIQKAIQSALFHANNCVENSDVSVTVTEESFSSEICE